MYYIKIWLVGSTGLLGGAIKKALTLANYPYVDTYSTLDIGNYSLVLGFATLNNINLIINCAAYSHVDGAETEKKQAYHTNAKGVKNLAITMRNLKGRLIHFSSDYVFDGSSSFPYREDDTPKALNVYGQSKIAGDWQVNHIIKNSIIIRTSWLYGDGDCFIQTLLKIFGRQKKIVIVTDQHGSPTLADDLAIVVVNIINKPWAKGIYNYSSEGVASWYEVASFLYQQSKLLGLAHDGITIEPISSVLYSAVAKRPLYSVLDKSKIKRLLGIEIDDWKITLHRYLLGLK